MHKKILANILNEICYYNVLNCKIKDVIDINRDQKQYNQL